MVLFDAWFQVFSADHAIVWKDVSKAGDRLLLKVPVKEDGNFEILVQVGLSPNAGVYRISLDGQDIGEAFDLGSGVDPAKAASSTDQMFFEHSKYATQLQEISLGRHFVSKGDHELGVEALGPGRQPESSFLLDYVRLRKR